MNFKKSDLTKFAILQDQREMKKVTVSGWKYKQSYNFHPLAIVVFLNIKELERETKGI